MTPEENKMIPTNDELRSFIETIFAFFKEFIDLFDKIKAGLAETFAGYERQY